MNYTPLVALDSPLRMRADLNSRQAAQFDAIAVVATVISLQYGRLVALLADFEPDSSIEILLPDAWGIIDWVHRMDGLVRGLAQRPFVVEFRNTSTLVESHRHAVQHLNGTIPALDGSGRAPWGHLAWTRDLGLSGDGKRRAERRVTGSSLIGAVDQSFGMGTLNMPRSPIDNVSFYSADGESEIGLTGQHEALVRFIPELEAAVVAAGPPGPDGRLRIRR